MSNAKTIELIYDQIDAIVIEELQEAYKMNMVSERDEGGLDLGIDGDLLQSLDTVLEYYMAPSEHRKWKDSIDR
jgi:hypothetical protein